MHPKGKPGRTIEHLPAEIEKIYEEARTCMSTSSYTAVAMLCRVVLFRVAKDKKIPDPTPGQSPSYAACIDHLVDNGHVAVNDKEWVDKIRVFGNEANHELADTSEEDAQQALNFVAHILTSMYEYRGPVGTP